MMIGFDTTACPFSRSACAALVASCIAVLGAIDAVRADPAAPDAILPGRPDATAAETLDPAFLSTTAGISVRPPAGGKMIRRSGSGDEIVRFVSDVDKWSFVVSRVMLAEPVQLATRDAPGAHLVDGKVMPPPVAGFADTMAAQIPSDTPGKLLRSDYVPINGFDGAILASRYSDRGIKRLMQQAIVRRTDKTYYVLTYSVPLTQDEVETDPAANRALAIFNKVIDSVALIDQDEITRDQNERLIRTRALMVNWTPAKLRSVLVEKQWLRLLKDGKDVGYTYVVEEIANDLPRAGKAETEATDPNANGIRVGIRSRTLPQTGYIVDAESWMWVRYDPDNAADRDQKKLRNRQQQESFSNLLVTTQLDKKDAKPNFAMDVGNSVLRDRIVPKVVDDASGVGKRMEEHQESQIDLQVVSTSNLQQLPPVTRQLPPFYLTQAMVHLLPRLLPLREARTYMFATYVPETRQVMTRYVDVKELATVTIAGQQLTAIPIQERAGYEGSVTTHYLSPEGKYLGSVNEENHITILVSDEASLQSIWKDAKFERPRDVDDVKKLSAK